MKLFWKGSIAKNEEKKNCQIFIFHFQGVDINITCWLKTCISYQVYSQIWLYLPRDELIFLMSFYDDHHFGYIKKFPKNH